MPCLIFYAPHRIAAAFVVGVWIDAVVIGAHVSAERVTDTELFRAPPVANVALVSERITAIIAVSGRKGRKSKRIRTADALAFIDIIAPMRFRLKPLAGILATGGGN